ncbi:MAG: FAD-dependent oxidoreductase [Rectinemataceae bacterium]|nr:FAD-dependent oxidoreductase [Rectinemataceae bacterium]
MEKRVVIVGGVAAGATAAARIRRLDENASITIIEKGPYVSFANCGLPYRISGDITKRSALMLQTPEGFLARYKVEVLLDTEAIGIDRAARTVRVRSPEGEKDIPYDSLILAQGGSPIVPNIAGTSSPNVFRLWTIPDMDAIQKYLETEKPASAVVLGGGFIGLEVAEAFIKRGLATTIVELTDHLMPPSDTEFGTLIAEAFREAGAEVRTGVSVTSIDAATKTATLSDGSVIPAGIVLLSAGVRPNLDLARSAGLEIGASGGLSVDTQLATGDPHIWAAGDMIEIKRIVDGRTVRIPLAGPANRQGRIAGTNALGGSESYAGALGTSVFKAVESTFAMTGLSEKAARDAGFPIKTSTVFKGNHASYYPGATELALKLIYDGSSGRLLGAQAFGKSGVDKRIDVLATALSAGMKVSDLARLDLSYAPPYSSANDPINMAAFAAENDMSGYSPNVSPAEALSVAGDAVYLDVRTRGEFNKLAIAGSVNIPLDEIRDSLREIPHDRPIVIISRAGFEGHLAARILAQSGNAGFGSAIRYVSGGISAMRLFPAFESLKEV